jgi:hypothetical protein
MHVTENFPYGQKETITRDAGKPSGILHILP